ncbi:MAG: redoxin domain-containing protein [Deltaproteobacteria bacterium]|nr:redoxin domain-containing protein [Deltaproteobacteria bacterium]
MRALFLILAIVALLSLLPACGEKPPGGAESPAASAESQKSPEDQAFESVVNGFETGNFAGAIRAAQDFSDRYPESPRLPQVLYLSGRASISRGEFEAGEATLQTMLDRFPDNENAAFAGFYRAQAIYLKTHAPVKEYKLEREAAMPGYEQALAAFEEVGEKHKGDAEVAARSRLMAAQILYDMGRREESLKEFQAYQDEQPEGDYADQALFQIGCLLMDLERYEEATKIFDRLTREYPGNPNSGAAIDRIREMTLIGRPMPPLDNANWVTKAKKQDTSGKVVLIVFFNTWCPHCQHEVPRLEKVYRDLKDRGLVVLALTSHSKEQTDETVRGFASKHGLTFPIGVEPGKTADAYAVGRIPAAAIIDRAGVVRWRNAGDLVNESLVERFL